MLNSRKQIPRNYILWGGVAILVIAGIIVLTLAFNSSGNTGQDSVDAVYTNAAATLAAQQLTLGPATATPTLFSTATPSLTPTITPTFLALPLGPTNTLAAGGGGGSTAVGCNNSAFVSDVTIPDDTAMTAGQTFTKTWKLSNTGTCPWTTAYKVSFVSGNGMGGVATPLTVTVAPGASGDISVALTAPATAGDATGYWILTSDSGQNFGTSFYVKIKVGGTTTGTTGTVTVTATGVAAAPAAANNPTVNLIACALENGVGPKFQYSGSLNWEDKSNNETGFNIYINSTLVTTVSANSTTYTLPTGVFFDSNTPSFAVEAVNGTLKATQALVSGICPP
ncbi:MAG: hypothetical protein J0L96_17535 [Anaerolineae bacterium]|nr:hypothetical protein [Anaerolineae bacterium]